MAIPPLRAVSYVTLLKLGRVSNLPTVWTNVLAGTVLAAGELPSWRTGAIALAMSLFYVGGMYLNDYFDRVVDAKERPERPIPAGEISAEAVAAIGFAMLVVGMALMASTGIAAALTGILLSVVIVGYDLFHKGNPLAPIIMGLCRALVYCGAAAAAIGGVSEPVVIAALALLAYVAGITYAARQESLDTIGSLWPLLVLSTPMVVALPVFQQGAIAIMIYVALIASTSCAVSLLFRRPMGGAVPRAVALLIAGISLVDAAFLAAVGAILPALAAVAGFGATLLFQKYIAGT